MKSKRLKMIQRSNHKWDLVSPKDKVITGDITINSIFEAIAYVEAYISSFQGWSYIVIPQKDKK